MKLTRLWVKSRELLPVFGVSLGVALAFTAAAAAVSQYHQVAAEDQPVAEVKAVAGPGNSQTLAIQQWGVQLTLPLGQGISTVVSASRGHDSAGLSTSELEQQGVACRAQDNALGTLLRLPAGEWANYPQSGQTETFLATVGNYDYVYKMPRQPCQGTEAVAGILAQGEAAIQGSGQLQAAE
jgi:hypothetical protein